MIRRKDFAQRDLSWSFELLPGAAALVVRLSGRLTLAGLAELIPLAASRVRAIDTPNLLFDLRAAELVMTVDDITQVRRIWEAKGMPRAVRTAVIAPNDSPRRSDFAALANREATSEFERRVFFDSSAAVEWLHSSVGVDA